MGAVLALPLLGSLGGLAGTAATACIGGAAFFCTSTAAGALTKSCNCNSSVATRVGFSLIFLLNSLLAWIMLTDWAVKLIAKWSWDYVKMSCEDGRCYGVLAVHRICFALALFHGILGLLLIGVKDTRVKRAAIQNGWWGPKVGIWIVLVLTSFAIPNPFFIFYSSYVSLPGATLFILLGLILLIDFAHSWSETCLQKWEETDSPWWKWTLISSTLGLYVVTIVLVVLQYVFFAGHGCGVNKAFISTNLALSIIVTGISISPAVQEANPRSGLAQSGMVVAYTTYLVTSAIANHVDDPNNANACNPLQSRANNTQTSMVLLGAFFTFLAIAYSTSRAATQSTALVGNGNRKRLDEGGYSSMGGGSYGEEESSTAISDQPKRADSLRSQALRAAVEAGSLPASALEDDDEDEEDNGENDDERTGTRYNYAWFHVVFVLGTMYVAMLLTNWNVITSVPVPSFSFSDLPGSVPEIPVPGSPILIGSSHVAMWMRIVSSWVCLVLYAWSLLAPVVLPDRFGI